MLFFRKKKVEVKYPFEMERAPLPEGTSYLGKNLDIVGTVSGDGSMIIMGFANGIFDMAGELNIGGTAKISGELRSKTISVSGFVEGTLMASKKIHLDATANTKGIIVTPALSITEGAFFEGEVKMTNGPEQSIEFDDDGQNKKAGIIKMSIFNETTAGPDSFAKPASVIGRSSRIEGDITGDEDIIIEGSVKGLIKTGGSILVGASGVIEADVEAENISVLGYVTGNVAVRGQLDIQPSGRISGDISARSIDIKKGASFEGRSRMVSVV